MKSRGSLPHLPGADIATPSLSRAETEIAQRLPGCILYCHVLALQRLNLQPSDHRFPTSNSKPQRPRVAVLGFLSEQGKRRPGDFPAQSLQLPWRGKGARCPPRRQRKRGLYIMGQSIPNGKLPELPEVRAAPSLRSGERLSNEK